MVWRVGLIVPQYGAPLQRGAYSGDIGGGAYTLLRERARACVIDAASLECAI
jgi:hypothetical protein